MFKTPKFSAPAAPQPEDSTAAAYKDSLKRAGMKGFASTISPGSLMDSTGKASANPMPAKTLLGM